MKLNVCKIIFKKHKISKFVNVYIPQKICNDNYRPLLADIIAVSHSRNIGLEINNQQL